MKYFIISLLMFLLLSCKTHKFIQLSIEEKLKILIYKELFKFYETSESKFYYCQDNGVLIDSVMLLVYKEQKISLKEGLQLILTDKICKNSILECDINFVKSDKYFSEHYGLNHGLPVYEIIVTLKDTNVALCSEKYIRHSIDYFGVICNETENDLKIELYLFGKDAIFPHEWTSIDEKHFFKVIGKELNKVAPILRKYYKISEKEQKEQKTD